MGGWYLLVHSYSFNQLKIKILLTYLLIFLLTCVCNVITDFIALSSPILSNSQSLTLVLNFII